MPDCIQMLIEIALQEDIGSGDITSDALFGDELVEKTGVIVAKEEGGLIVAGLEIARRVFLTVDHHLNWERTVEDGARVEKGAKIARISGRFKSLLRAERTALNFLQHLSGVATLTSRFVEAVKGTKVQILDTRKTLPGFRALEKMAVRTGGGKNHRLGLYDRYLIKDNHLMGLSIREAVERAKKHNVNRVPIEIEVGATDVGAYGHTPLRDQIEEAISAGAEILLIDNVPPPELKKAVEQVAGRAKVEASGGITLENVRVYAETGADFISVGALTHSAKAVDLSLEVG